MNHNYRLTLAFDGTSYQGWQRQNSTDQTIQGTLERTCAAILREPVRLIGSGRTDAGVHAEAMTAHFFTKKPILDGAAFRQLMNGTLPEDIRLLAIRPVAADFHSRYSAVGKIYRYQIDTGEKMDVFRRKYACHYTAPLDLAAMERAARYLEGTNDFSSFTIDRTPGKSKVRTIRAIRMEQQGNLLLIRYEGDGFLYNMVRILTGTLLEVGDGRKQAEDIPAILEKKQRAAAGFTAPAQGLFLERVLYEEADIQEQC